MKTVTTFKIKGDVVIRMPLKTALAVAKIISIINSADLTKEDNDRLYALAQGIETLRIRFSVHEEVL